MKHLIAWTVLALLILPTAAVAQVPRLDLRLVTSVGSYLPTGDLGTAGAGDGPESPEFLYLSRGTAAGLALEAPVHAYLDLRGTLRYGFGSSVVAGDRTGTEPCGTDCSVTTYEHTTLTSASALVVAAALALRPAPAGWVVQPYAMGGAGFRRHFYDRSALPEGGAAVEAEEEASRWVPHLGVGADAFVGGVSFRLEAEMFGEVELDGWIPRGGRYGDAFISLGVGWTP